MKKILISGVCLLFLMSASCSNDENGKERFNRSESYQKGPYSLIMSYPDGDAQYGSKIEIKLNLKYPEGEKWELLPLNFRAGEDLSNTIVHDISQSPQVLIGDSLASSNITIEMEAYLPGEIVIPPLTVRFLQDITTDETVINVVSAFDEEGDQNKLAPLWVPETKKHSILIIIISALAILFLAVVLIIIAVRKRGLKVSSIELKTEKTIDELIDDFKKDFIKTDEITDLRDAFRQLFKIMELLPLKADKAEKREEYKAICLEFGFSRGGLASGDSRKRMNLIWNEIKGDNHNDF